MAEIKRDVNMNSNKGVKKNKKKKLRLKKSVRRTIGALLLVTALIVAAIPAGTASADEGGTPGGGSGATSPGSTVAAPDIDTILASTKYSNPVPGTTAIKSYTGGYPLITQTDSPYQPVIRDFGGYQFYEVDYNGYSTFGPIYELGNTDKSKKYPYLISYIGESSGRYVPPNGNINLVIGTVDPERVDGTDNVWYANDPDTGIKMKYVASLTECGGRGSDKYYIKKISIYSPKDKDTYKATFKINAEDTTVYAEIDVPRGGYVPAGEVPDPTAPTGQKFDYWEPRIETTVIDKDTLFIAHFSDTSGPSLMMSPPPASDDGSLSDDPSAQDPDSLDPKSDPNMLSDDPDSDADPSSDPSGSLDPSSDAEPIPTSDPSSASDEPTSTADPSSTPESSPTSGEDGGSVPEGGLSSYWEDTIDAPVALAGGPIVPVLLSGGEPDDGYKTTPDAEYYVCDKTATNYEPINYICDNAFKDTTNVQHLQMPEYIYGIGDSAFEECSNLKDITLGSGLQYIGKKAFYDCRLFDVAYFHDTMALSQIGDGAFAGSGLKSLSCIDNKEHPYYTDTSIPDSVTEIGNAAFYGTGLTSVGFQYSKGCTIGDYVFANCTNMSVVDLDHFEQSTNTILNLSGTGAAEGTFRGCTSLSKIALPTKLEGSIPKDTFGNCTTLANVVVRNINTDFADGEFNSQLIIVEGPKPAVNQAAVETSLDPGTNIVKAYKRCIDSKNNFTYRYYDNNAGCYYDYVNQKATTDGTAGDPKEDFIFELRNDGTVTKAFDTKAVTAPVKLEIGNTVGDLLYPNPLVITAIGNSVFEGNSTIQSLVLPYTISSVGNKAFSGCSRLKEVTVNTAGTAFGEEAFSHNDSLENVLLKYAGPGNSSMGKMCFGECPKLKEIDFFDDDYETGNKDAFVNFPMGSIANDAFYTTGRTETLVFKGPMIRDYAPYDMAINPSKPGISNLEIYIDYISGNPYNLECQYMPETTGTDRFGRSVTYPSGVYLLAYPNQTTYVHKTDLGVGDKTVKDMESIPVSTRSKMCTDCIYFTKNVVVPYGIDFIDKAESKITDPSIEYLKFNDSNELYMDKGTGKYEQFNYVPYLESVTFEEGGPQIFPDRMFEGCPDLTSVAFMGDVVKLGQLPFYYADSEDQGDGTTVTYKSTFSHNDPSPSKMAGVGFFGDEASTGMADNPKYSCTNGIIKSFNGEKTTVEQILPGRGEAFGEAIIAADELADVNDFRPYAAKDCDSIQEVNLSAATGIKKIDEGVFYDCDKLSKVTYPDTAVITANDVFKNISTSMFVTFPTDKATFGDYSFEPASKDGKSLPYVTFYVHKDAENLINYAGEHPNITIGEFLKDTFTLEFKDYDGTILLSVPITSGEYGINYEPEHPVRENYDFTGWKAKDADGNEISLQKTPLYSDTSFTAQYEPHKDVKKYTVYFYDDDGKTLISKSTVEEGKYAIPPTEDPTKKGFNFAGWSPRPAATVITEDTNFIATYTAGNVFTVRFVYEDGTLIGKDTVAAGEKAVKPANPVKPGYVFSHWTPDPTAYIVTEDTDFIARFALPTGTPTKTPTSSSSKSSSSSSSGSTNKSSSSSSSSTASIAHPIIITSTNGAPMPMTQMPQAQPVNTGNYNVSSSGGTSKPAGKTSVVSTADGISDVGKMSATVNGSSDNYVIKITQTQEANDSAVAALSAAYGDISPIRYLPMDISLYDSTGTNKISPIPEGMSVSITMPIPDDLAIYGGNSRVASTVGGTLERLNPRFTVINSVPCMTFTANHFSPYVVYVDTNNLTEAGIADATPKTADGIHPKWFLCIGLVAIAVILFIKKDPEEYLKVA